MTDDNRLSVRYTLYFVAFFIALSDSNWLYLWDFLDIIVFTLFIYGILAYKNNWYFLFVFGIAILNKESGLFIALWLILDALIEKRDTNSFYFAMKLRDLKRLFLGIALLVGGIFFVEWIRDALFIKSAAGGGVKFTGIEYGKYVHFKFLINLKVFVYNLTNLNFFVEFPSKHFYFGTSIVCYYSEQKGRRDHF
ncbi:membrane protein [Beggiatoa sp. PS]|nr:membrane protein [Beggiatoa sp. PS]